MKWAFLIRAAAILLLAIVPTITLAQADRARASSERQKVIDFEDEVVEGMNKRPLDSLSQISENGKRKRKPHLYRKRGGFRTEIRETLGEMRYN